MARKRPAGIWSRVRHFTERDIWERDRESFSALQRPLIVVLRLVALVWHGVARHDITMRASALTYITVFSLVPTLAVAFAMFKAFGGLQDAEQVLLPKIMDYLAVGVRDQVAATVDQFLSNMNTSTIGATGIVFVVIAVVMLLSSIEDVFNEIWGVVGNRSYFARVTIYWSVVTITPTLLLLGVSLPAIVRRIAPLQWMLDRTGTVEIFFSVLLPLVVVCAGFAVMYALLTGTRVPWSAAGIGGVVGGTLWFACARGYGWYARHTVYYANIYGSLSAVPIFLFWIYICWLVVLIGAQVAFASQNLSTYREELLAAEASQAMRELLALRITTEVARRFMGGTEPPMPETLARALHTSARMVNEVVDVLLAIGALREAGEQRRLLPGRDPAHLTPAELLRELRRHGAAGTWPHKDGTTRALERLWHEAEAAGAGAWSGVSFVDLATSSEDTTEIAHDGTPHSSRRRWRGQ